MVERWAWLREEEKTGIWDCQSHSPVGLSSKCLSNIWFWKVKLNDLTVGHNMAERLVCHVAPVKRAS